MQDEGDGFKGKVPDPKVSIHTGRAEPSIGNISQPSRQQQQQQRFSMEMEQENYEEKKNYNTNEEQEELTSAEPKYNHSELYQEDVPPRRKYALYDDDTITTNTQLSSQQQPASSQYRRASYTRRASSSGLEEDEQECAPPPEREQQRQRRRRSRSRSLSPGGRRRSQSRSVSPGGGTAADGRRHRRNSAAQQKNCQKSSTSTIGSSIGNNSDEDYHLMPLEMDANNNNNQTKTSNRNTSLNKSSKNATMKEAEEKYEAQIAFSLQMAFSFFCCVLILAIIMAATMVSGKGYFVVVLAFLALLLSLAVGLCYFVYHILNEEESELNNPNHQKHMPKWYKTVTKIIRDELKDFKDDWKAMCNNMLLLEDGGDSNNENNVDNDGSEYDQFQDEGMEVPSVKPKKRLGKSNLFRIVISPAAALVNFRRKRKEKKRQKKAQARVIPFPSTV